MEAFSFFYLILLNLEDNDETLAPLFLSDFKLQSDVSQVPFRKTFLSRIRVGVEWGF